MIFAEVFGLGSDATDLAGVAKWLIIFGFLIGIYLKMRGWEKGMRGEGERREIGPQPFTVAAAARFASHEEHRELCRRVEKLETTIDVGIEKLGAEGSRRAASIHQRVDKVASELSATTKAIEIVGNTVAKFDEKLDDLRDQVAKKEDRR